MFKQEKLVFLYATS